jgi:hypothetical protein
MMQYVNRRNLFIWFAIIFAFYLILTKIDLIVHYDLYQYGLRFDKRWAEPYWYCLTASFIGLAALSVSSYWLESRNKNKYLCILIVLTILVPYTFGFEDVLWFSWHGQFPAENVVWEWYWLNSYFSPWTTQKHIIYSIVGLGLLVACWGVFLGKKWVQFSFNYLRGYKPRKMQ